MSPSVSKRKCPSSRNSDNLPDMTFLQSEKKSTNRSRGGQPGNTNALKHGFYSRRFRDIEFSDLDVITVADLQNEIAIMRVLMRRTFDLASDYNDLAHALSAVNVLGAGSTRIAGLLKAQAILFNKTNDASEAISIALQRVVEELHLKSPNE